MGLLEAMVTDLTNDPLSYFYAVGMLLGGGAIMRYVLRRYAPAHRQITWVEFAVVGLIVVFVQVPLVNVAMIELARHHAVSGYQELWGGKYDDAYPERQDCHIDTASCGDTHECQPYKERVLDYYKKVKDPDTYDAKTKTWNRNNSHQEAVYKWVTKYHQCPYFKYMTKWMLKDSFGEEHTVATTVPLKPERFEAHVPFRQDLVPSAPPEFWSKVKAVVDSGGIYPVQTRRTYKNPLLAMQADQIRTHSGKVGHYRGRQLLVDHTHNLRDNPITSNGYAHQVMFVRNAPPNANDFQFALARLNTELGKEHQGDMNVLVVPASVVGEHEGDDFTDAHKAWWQSPEYGKVGLPKNAIMVVLGVSDDFKTIVWSRARTGIDFGNNAMLLALGQLDGKPFDPEGLFGNPTFEKGAKGKITYHPSDGLIEKIVMTDYAFKRPCMYTCEKGQEGGFEYVSARHMMSAWDMVLLYSVNLIAGGLLFLLVARVEFTGEGLRLSWEYIRQRKWRRL